MVRRRYRYVAPVALGTTSQNSEGFLRMCAGNADRSTFKRILFFPPTAFNRFQFASLAWGAGNAVLQQYL